ncbi:NAD(P)H-hydrate dehydratase [Clostridium estertheticum]|uniref:NAD(P)H-hydrate dehydratase n=1 Tax=Clostridium estertheticum TaxID=238834 RepID=UPI001C6E0449|nr:NAD(P)H-hydrate dehydratase [Clostridium estertheticum]MBW9151722.1 NAD(P)H-hydrate dehydratase [Clostridium estertheticum]WLC85526.1 NAD(P)H-hydrate dehydratase [Clostridium estertheticum]
MKIATAQIMRKIDRYCIDVLGIRGIILMENAALKVMKNIPANNKKFVIVCSSGNNGGDGFVVARHLLNRGNHVEVFYLGSDENMSADALVNFNIIRNMGAKIIEVNNNEELEILKESIIQCEITIDAIFGTGLSREVKGIYSLAITIMNENSKYILSIDVPSGFECNSGKVMGNCIRSNKTVTFELYKKGFISYDAESITGEIVIEKIGIPKAVVDKFHEDEYIMDIDFIKGLIKKRNKYSHKGDYGRTLILAGSPGFTGAAYISTQAAVRSGAGLVTLGCDSSIQNILSGKLVEAMTVSTNDEIRLDSLITKSDSIAIGPGLGNNKRTLNLLNKVLLNSKCPVVIDSDGLNVLEGNLEMLKNKKCKIVLTPHMGEMARISGFSIDETNKNKIDIAKEFAKKHNVVLLLKGFNTIITDGETVQINPTGSSAMASGGMGDCLTGIIASFISQGYDIMTAACIGAYIHGYSGDKLSKKMFCVNANHIIEALPSIIKEIQDLE